MQQAHQVQGAPPAAVLVGPLAAERGLHAAGGVPPGLLGMALRCRLHSRAA